MRFDSGPEVFVLVNRNYVLTEYVLNENDCMSLIRKKLWYFTFFHHYGDVKIMLSVQRFRGSLLEHFAPLACFMWEIIEGGRDDINNFLSEVHVMLDRTYDEVHRNAFPAHTSWLSSPCNLPVRLLLSPFSLLLVNFLLTSRADNLVLVKFGFSALSVPRFFGV